MVKRRDDIVLPLWRFVVSIIVGLCFALQAHATALPSGITYHGRLLQSDGVTPVTGIVTFDIQIKSPDSSNCVLYEETQTQNLSGTAGVFSLTINDGSGTRTDAAPQMSIDDVFSNRTTVNHSCGGGPYTPNPGDGRILKVTFQSTTMAMAEPMPDQSLNFAPLAIESKQISGYAAENILRFENADHSLFNTSPLNNAQYDELVRLVNGTSTAYASAPNGATGTIIYASSSGSLTAAGLGDMWLDTSAGGNVDVLKISTRSGIQEIPLDASGNFINAVTQGTGISVSTTGGNATVSIANGGVTAAKLDPAINIGTTGYVSAHSLGVSNSQTTPNTVGLVAPAAVFASYSLVLPPSPGTSGQVLKTDGLGNLSWTDTAAGSLASAHIFVGNASNVATDVAMSGDANIDNTGAVKVTGLQGVGISTTAPLTGQVLVYNGGLSKWQAQNFSIGSLIGAGGTTQFANASCSSSQTLTWSSLTDTFACSSISGLDAGAIATGTIDPARLPATATDWANNGPNIYNTNTGNVGIGTTAPASGYLSVEQVSTNTMSPTAAGYFSQSLTMTANGSAAPRGLNIQPHTAIASGIVSTGTLTGETIWSLRNFGTTGDNGTIASDIGLNVNYGHYNSDNTATPQTSGSAYGVYVQPTLRSGHVGGNMYDVYIGTTNLIGGATLGGTHYGVFQSDTTSPNYFGSKVGIGTSAPGYTLDVAGPVNATQLLVNGVDISGGGAGAWTVAGGNAYRASGNVGIGTSTPSEILEVAGAVRATGSIATFEANSASMDYTGGNTRFYSLGPDTATRGGFLFRTLASNGSLGAIPFVIKNDGNSYFNGNVGVGTTAPAAKLEVDGTGTYGLLYLNNTNTSGTGAIRSGLALQNGGANKWLLLDDVSNAGDSDFMIFNATTFSNALAIKSANGNVGIGTTTPAYKLDVAGPVNATALKVNGVDVSGGAGAWATSGSNIYNTNTSYVGIGTTAPVSRLTVDSGTAGLPGTITLTGLGTGVTKIGSAPAMLTPSAAGDFGIGTSPGQKILLGTNGLTRLTIDAAGNVGIGTTIPGFNLDVNGDINVPVNDYFRVGGAGILTYTSPNTVLRTPPAGGFLFNINTTSAMAIANTGNVGIGTTSPISNLTVSGAGSASGGYSLGYFGSGTAGTPANLYGIMIDKANVQSLMLGINKNAATGSVPASSTYISTYSSSGTISMGRGNSTGLPNTADLLISSTGNVGIGTTAPNYMLDVAGAVNATQLLVNGTDVSGGAGAWTVAGGNVYRSSGNVGIGTTTPGGILEVVSTGGDHWKFSNGSRNLEYSNPSGGANTALQLGNYPSTGLTGPGISFAPNGSSTIETYGVAITATAARTLAFGTSNTTNIVERMRIDSSGNVGIGTTNPAFKLDVNGSFSAANIGVGVSAASWPINVGVTDSSTGLQIFNRSSTAARYPAIQIENFDGAGLGGFPVLQLFNSRGTTSSILTTQAGDALGAIQFLGQGNTTGNGGTGASISATATENFVYGTNSGGMLRFNTTANGTSSTLERMRIDQSGKVGIGTTTPAYKLDVAGAVNATQLLVNGTDVSGGAGAWTVAGGNAYRATGNVGIGTTAPSSGLDAIGGIRLGSSVTGDAFVSNGTGTFIKGGPGNAIYFAPISGSNIMAVTSAGSVGIGTTAPSYPLDVTGAIRTGASSTPGQLFLSRSSDGNPSFVIANYGAEHRFQGAQANDYFTFITNASTSAMIINASGNVGIGTTTAFINAKLTLDSDSANLPGILALTGLGGNTTSIGAANAFLTPSTAGDFGINAAGHNFLMGVGGTTRLAITSTGLVGIGTTTPNVPLGFAPANGDKIALWDNGTARYGMGIQNNLMQFYTASGAADIAFGWGTSASFTERMRVMGTGNVGIGTTTPNYLLDVAGAVNATALKINGVDISGGASAWAINGTSIYNTNTGNVGIGTTAPGSILEVKSSSPIVRITNTGDPYGSFVANTYGTLYLGQQTGGTYNGRFAIGMATGKVGTVTNTIPSAPVFRNLIDDGSGNASFAGNVGIGTSTPQATLDINGFAKLKMNSSAPIACASTGYGSLAMTSTGTLCSCTASGWVKSTDGSTSCSW